MSKVLLGGDTHGNPWAIQYLFEVAFQYECDKIFQLGDFGFWEHEYGGPEFLDVTSEFATLNNIPFYWLDGNHENHTMLHKNYSDKVVDDGMWEIRKNLYYSPRGNRFTWDGVDFMSFGGAFSIDRSMRRVGTSFWFEEEIEAAQITAAIKDKSTVDVLLCHDLPAGVDMAMLMANKGGQYRVIREAEKGRQQLRRLVKTIQPTQIYHGHYHINYVQYVDYGYNQVKVTGLNCDGSGQESWTILNTEDFHD